MTSSATTDQSKTRARLRPLAASSARAAGSPASRTTWAARASASSFWNVAPALPPSSTRRKAGRSLATTGAPALMASTRTIPKLSPPVWGATYRSTDASSDALSASLTAPRNSLAAATSGAIRSRAAAASPGPTTSSLAPGYCARTVGIAAASTGSPLRGSSRRPRNAIVGAPSVPCHSGRAAALAKRSTLTPLGITTASPPTCVVTVRRASSDTAIRPAIFSRLGRSRG